jgi:putative FmdB family regulatory protein
MRLMPIYEFKCESCGNKFEKLLRRSGETEQLACPSCGDQHLSQQFSTFAAHAGSAPARSEMPMCPSGGMCQNPGLCGRN